MADKTYSDEEFINALNVILSDPSAYAADVSELVGCNARYATVRLKALVDKGIIKGEMKPRGWAFKLK